MIAPGKTSAVQRALLCQRQQRQESSRGVAAQSCEDQHTMKGAMTGQGVMHTSGSWDGTEGKTSQTSEARQTRSLLCSGWCHTRGSQAERAAARALLCTEVKTTPLACRASARLLNPTNSDACCRFDADTACSARVAVSAYEHLRNHHTTAPSAQLVSGMSSWLWAAVCGVA